MALLTLDELRALLVACAGDDEEIDLSGDILDTTFEDLGYDSLALMETTARIERDFGVPLSEEEVADGLTPRALLELVNNALAIG